jgi:hypothetical protein
MRMFESVTTVSRQGEASGVRTRRATQWSRGARRDTTLNLKDPDASVGTVRWNHTMARSGHERSECSRAYRRDRDSRNQLGSTRNLHCSTRLRPAMRTWYERPWKDGMRVY